MNGNATAQPVQQRTGGDSPLRVAGRAQPTPRGRLFAALFWAFTALAVAWLAIGLLPGALAVADLSFREMLAVAPGAPWLRSAWTGLFLASLRAEPAPALAMQYAFSFLNVALGVVLYRARPGDWTARVLALGMVGTAAIFNYQAHSTLEMMGPLVTTVHEFLHVFSGSMYLIALLLFPDGRLPAWPGRRWRPPAIAGQVFGPLAIFGLLLFGYVLTWALHGEPASFVAFYGVVVPVVGISAQGVRYIAGSGQERQLSKTLILALTLSLAAALALGAGLWLASAGPLGLPRQTQDALERLAFVVFPLLFALLPLSLTAIVLRYRLWEIDLVINRSLVYGSLTAFIIAVYGLVVGGLGVLLGAQGGASLAAAATVVVAILFQPLRAALQRRANRLMYGERDDPIAVLTRLGRQLEAATSPDALLPAVTAGVAQALRLPYVAIAVTEGDEFTVLAQYPVQSAPWPENAPGQPVRRVVAPPPVETVSFPLIRQGVVIGGLFVAPRVPGAAFSPADRRLLTSLAHRAGAAVETVQLTSDLQRSRERLVVAREEERRRLRRDLHDGLGPQLAALTLKLDAARNVLAGNPQQAGQLLDEVRVQTQVAVGDVRRLVYDLRPPALDQLGLVGALQQQAAQTTTSGLAVQVLAPPDLPALPAAVEVAAYRIVAEALTNAVRHSQARRCAIWLCLDDALYVAVDDDGVGPPSDLRAGVGLMSMRERAEELGGACRIERRPEGGSRVIARLPIDQAEARPPGEPYAFGKD
jgi:signal transduction histidine kinase